MPTNKQKREAARRHLERQLKRRAEREQARRRFTIIGSVLGTIILVAAIVTAVVLIGHKDKDKTTAGSSTTPSDTTSASTSSTGTSCEIGSVGKKVTAKKATAGKVTFAGITVTGATDLKGEPTATSKVTTNATKLQVKDLVTGTGKAATPSSCVTVQYVGFLYKNGTVFDASWKTGYATQFPLTGVVPGFTQGIGGNTSGVAAMKIGGRRIIIVPPAMGYPNGSGTTIPKDSTIVFIVDLISLTPQAIQSS